MSTSSASSSEPLSSCSSSTSISSDSSSSSSDSSGSTTFGFLTFFTTAESSPFLANFFLFFLSSPELSPFAPFSCFFLFLNPFVSWFPANFDFPLALCWSVDVNTNFSCWPRGNSIELKKFKLKLNLTSFARKLRLLAQLLLDLLTFGDFLHQNLLATSHRVCFNSPKINSE